MSAEAVFPGTFRGGFFLSPISLGIPLQLILKYLIWLGFLFCFVFVRFIFYTILQFI